MHNPLFAPATGGEPRNTVLESALSHVQGSSGYGIAAGGSNSPDLVGGALTRRGSRAQRSPMPNLASR